jgi:hypothetical protein
MSNGFGSAFLMTLVLLGVMSGCGTTRMTDTQRTATEQLLVSNAIDQAVSELDFRELAGKSVFFDPQYVEGVVDRGYLVSSLRQQLLAQGCMLQEEKAKATYVVEVRAGGIGTDRHAVLVGIPQMNVPTFVPGQPSQIPEVPLAKKTDQEGVAKIAVFAYNRLTGKPVWQSGVVKAMSTSKDTWVLGAGPFQQGTIRTGTEFAGEPLPLAFKEGDARPDEVAPLLPVTHAASWPEMPSARADSKWLAYQLANAPMEERPRIEVNQAVLWLMGDRSGPPQPAVPRAWPWNAISRDDAAAANGSVSTRPLAPPVPAPPSNAGGQAETEPNKIMTSGLGAKTAGSPTETEPSIIWDSATGAKPDK